MSHWVLCHIGSYVTLGIMSRWVLCHIVYYVTLGITSHWVLCHIEYFFHCDANIIDKLCQLIDRFDHRSINSEIGEI